MSELIDIFDANLKPKGKMERKEAHLSGEWHHTFHLWLCSSRHNGSLMFQLRSPDAKNFPGMLDVTAAGHLLTGETLEDGTREAQEELGIAVKDLEIRSLGYRVEVADQENGQRNREYQGVFLAKDERSLDDYRPDPNEVYGVIDVPISDGYALFGESQDTIVCNYYAYDGEKWFLGEKELSRQHFLPRIQQYYLTMFIMSERLLEGKSPISIS